MRLWDKDGGPESSVRNFFTLLSAASDREVGCQGFAYDRDLDSKVTSQAFPALSVNPLDVAGAGDSLLAVMATGLSSGEAMMPTAVLACCMASLAVETMGNTPISAKALRNHLEDLLQL